MENPKSPFDGYKNPVHSFLELEEICELLSKDLIWAIPEVDKRIFLLSLAGVESSFANNGGPRFEEAYAPKGIYFANHTLQNGFQVFGALASCSFGPWQILWINCKEEGYEGHPLELMRAETSGTYVIQKLNKICQNGANSVERLLSAWNTGGFKDQEEARAVQYIASFWHYYHSLTENKPIS